MLVKLQSKTRLGSNTNLLDGVEVVASLVVPLTRQTFGVPAVQIRIAGLANKWAEDVLARDHRQAVAVVTA